jgi:hypothetical protein
MPIKNRTFWSCLFHIETHVGWWLVVLVLVGWKGWGRKFFSGSFLLHKAIAGTRHLDNEKTEADAKASYPP